MSRFSIKFYLGVLFILLSLILGKLTTFTFLFYFEDTLIVVLSIIVYVLSWPMLIIGVWWAGREYWESVKKYSTYGFYHRSIKKGTKKAYHAGKRLHEGAKNKVKKRFNAQ